VTGVIKLDGFRQAKQKNYLGRYRTRLDAFIRARVPLDWAQDMMRLAESYQHNCRGQDEIVWDYVELRDMLLQLVTEEIAKELYVELQKQFWFDPRWVTLDAVAERCLSHMILGDAWAATSQYK
jgi:hypothetical protein